MSIVNTDYETYKKWKSWGAGRQLEPWLARYFQLEVSRAGLLHFNSVLEVGFGNGEFLDWAKQNGASPVGLEIIEELVSLAEKDGFEVYHWNLVEGDEKESPLDGRLFDCVVAFDVIEHLTIEQAQVALQRMAALLQPGGKVLLRFPNGESPFYLPLQNGDYTHRIDVTRSKLEHLCLGSGLELECYYNSVRVAANRSTAWIKWLVFRARDIIELVVGYLYYSKRRPLDPAATAILRKIEN